MFLMFFYSMYVFLFKKTFIILTWPEEPQDKCSLDSEWTKKIIFPTPDKSVCFVLF